jgi:hypothetical protein
MFGDDFQFRLDTLFFGRDKVKAGVAGLNVVNDSGTEFRQRTYDVRAGARFGFVFGHDG